MSLAASAGEWTQMRFSRDLGETEVDTQLAQLSSDRWRSRLSLDLTETTDAHIPAVLRILALINDRDNEGLETIIALPRSPALRKRLEDWDFPATAAMVCRSPIRRLLWERPPSPTRDRVGIHQERPLSRADDRYGGVFDDRLLGFMTYLFETDTQASSVIDTEWARWRSPLVLSMFGARLGKRSPEIARVVIYELLANAVQHSHANLVVVAAHAQRPAGRGPRRPTEELTISVWDNGDSVTHALREQFDRSEPAPSSLVPNDTFLLESVGWTAVTDRYRAGWAPRVDAPDEEFLISSLYPSGPCPGNRSHRFEQYPAVSVTKQRQAYNLHALYRCVVDLFSGVLEIRTGSQLMTLGLGQKQNKRRFYNMRLQRIGGRPFRGNLFTIRIPLAHAQ